MQAILFVLNIEKSFTCGATLGQFLNGGIVLRVFVMEWSSMAEEK